MNKTRQELANKRETLIRKIEETKKDLAKEHANLQNSTAGTSNKEITLQNSLDIYEKKLKRLDKKLNQVSYEDLEELKNAVLSKKKALTTEGFSLFFDEEYLSESRTRETPILDEYSQKLQDRLLNEKNSGNPSWTQIFEELEKFTKAIDMPVNVEHDTSIISLHINTGFLPSKAKDNRDFVKIRFFKESQNKRRIDVHNYSDLGILCMYPEKRLKLYESKVFENETYCIDSAVERNEFCAFLVDNFNIIIDNAKNHAKAQLEAELQMLTQMEENNMSFPKMSM